MTVHSTACSLTENVPRFRTIHLDDKGGRHTSVGIYQTTRYYIPDDNHLHNHRRENLKSHRLKKYFIWTKPRSIWLNLRKILGVATLMYSVQRKSFGPFLVSYLCLCSGSVHVTCYACLHISLWANNKLLLVQGNTGTPGRRSLG